MKIIRIKKSQNCSQSSNTVDIIFNNKITLKFLDYLSQWGKLEIFDNFEKPFFRLQYKSKYILKGALGNSKVRLYLPESNCDEVLDIFKKEAEGYRII